MNLFFTTVDSDCMYILRCWLLVYSLFDNWFCTRFASLHGVLPLGSSMGFVRSFLVLSTFVLGGGGGVV